MKQFEAEIISNRSVAPGWKELVLSWEPGAGRPEPGQFLSLRVSPRSDPLLRRPFAFSDLSEDGSRASAIYQVRGPATSILAELAPGSAIDAIGPLGRGFPRPMPGELPILAAGGIGLGPVLFLARSLAAPTLVLGFRDASALPDLELPEGRVTCTDDGSAGFHGNPAEWIARNVSADLVRLYGCGPAPMLAALAGLAAERSWATSLSAEQWMACGVGACMGCALRRSDGKGYLRACSDGPVFSARSGEASPVDWNPRRPA
ncbi:MAG TPA: dihydroorotate dehydrogenase electron transfer subunit [Rectinemataceae bacterium]|nr:dihydroorotate dehydrogenase electron transfer subunit [Rectinemataceae bacterium]